MSASHTRVPRQNTAPAQSLPFLPSTTERKSVDAVGNLAEIHQDLWFTCPHINEVNLVPPELCPTIANDEGNRTK